MKQYRPQLSLLLLLALFVLLPRGDEAVVAQEADTVLYLPLVQRPSPDLVVNPYAREASRTFFNTVYLASEGVGAAWTGDVGACRAGATSGAFREAIALRINYFRAMAGIPADVTLDDTYNQKAQQAALMMSANRRLSHDPDPGWLCYTADGDQAAGSSNLYLGVYGPAAISGYIRDPGDGNYYVGHRRWILMPATREMGTGDIPPAGSHPAANALWVFDDTTWGPRPATREPFVAWPPPGYVPFQVVYPRWSLSFPEADFSAATVSMNRGSQPIAVQVRPVRDGAGENTLVWEPAISFEQPAGDLTYAVQVANVRVDGSPRAFDYTVTVFDPAAPTLAPAPAPSLGPPPERHAPGD